MPEAWRIGTSGWNYGHWREVFYPPGISQAGWLEFYGERFDTVEVNATFYRTPKAETVERWYQRTPEGFLWSVKASRFITHIRRLKDCREPLERLYESVNAFKEKLGPILFQLPPNLQFDRKLFQDFCHALDPAYRHTMEVRHASWIDDALFTLLKQHNIAFCISDTAGKYPFREAVTADFVYIRLHGSRTLYASGYTLEELQAWAGKIRDWSLPAFLYFDNDAQGHAVTNASRLREILG